MVQAVSDRVEDLQDPVPQRRDGDLASRQGDIFYRLHELSRLTSMVFDALMQKEDITRGQWWAMMHILQNEGVTQIELAKMMQMGRAPLGQLLVRMEAKGWIERRDYAGDKRVKQVFLAQGAEAAVESMNKAALNFYATLLQGVTEAEQAQIQDVFSRIKENATR